MTLFFFSFSDPESTYNYVLPAGNHTMPFELPVPSDLPSSFEGTHGYVRYWLECILDVVGHPEHTTKKAFTVISKYNLNTDPVASVGSLQFTCLLMMPSKNKNSGYQTGVRGPQGE